MNTIEKNLDETNNTLVESTSRTYVIDGYPNENREIDETQNELKEYYTYPNTRVLDYDNENKSLRNQSCLRFPFNCHPKNAKVFIRRVDNKRLWYDQTYNVLNGSYNKGVGPYLYSSKDAFNRKKLEEHNKAVDRNENMEANEIFTLNNVNNNFVYSNDGYNDLTQYRVYSYDNAQLDVPLCVQEADCDERGYNLIFPANSINQDECYCNPQFPIVPDNEFVIYSQAVLNFVKIFFRYIFKVFKLAFEKIKRDFDTKEIYFDPGMLQFSDLDMSCELCRNKYGDILAATHERDCLKYFEGYDESRTIFRKAWDIVNNWIDARENKRIKKRKGKKKGKKNKTEVYYQTEGFPKDEQGKIELPTFKYYEKKKSVNF